MTERFKTFFHWLLKWEGTVFENDPDDPGGATKFGIDQRSHPNEDIRNLTMDRAAEIYWEAYWTPLCVESLPAKVGEVIANIGVNAGKSRAVKWLQAIVDAKVDGVIGSETIHKANAMDANDLANKLLIRTEGHYVSIAKGRMAKFLKGWKNRNNDLHAFLKLP